MNENSTSANKNKAINITPTAIEEIKRLLSQESEKNLFLRIGVAAGGCSGMSYMMAFDLNPAEHDQQYDYNGLKVVVDSRVLPHLEGSVLDFKKGLLGGGFHFENPNAKRSCGCGSSFTCQAMTFAVIDPSDFIAGNIFRQDEFLSRLEGHNWSYYSGKRVLVRGCQSTVIPPWAFMCFAAKLAPYASTVLYGNEHDHVVVARQAKSN